MMPDNDCLVHVANLPSRADEEFLTGFFGDYNIKSITLKQRKSGNFAFLEFNSQDDDLDAICGLNYT